MAINAKFEKCIKRNYDPAHDRYIINCKLGLWGVDAPYPQQAEKEAAHYFAQYYGDGEYDNLLSEQADKGNE